MMFPKKGILKTYFSKYRAFSFGFQLDLSSFVIFFFQVANLKKSINFISMLSPWQDKACVAKFEPHKNWMHPTR